VYASTGAVTFHEAQWEALWNRIGQRSWTLPLGGRDHRRPDGLARVTAVIARRGNAVQTGGKPEYE
jgi:hypothetical protein